MKKLTALILSLILLLTATTPAFAAQTETTVTPRYINTSQAGVTFAILEGGVAEWTIACFGESSCTSIDAVTYVERKMGTVWMRMSVDHPIKEYYYSVTGAELVNTYQLQLNFAGEYRAVVEFTVHGTVEDEELKFWSYREYAG